MKIEAESTRSLHACRGLKSRSAPLGCSDRECEVQGHTLGEIAVALGVDPIEVAPNIGPTACEPDENC